MIDWIDHQLHMFSCFVIFLGLGAGVNLRRMFGPDWQKKLGGFLVGDAGKSLGKAALTRFLKGR